MSPLIQLLSDHLISQIAAGEVVERPASVVKELVENSLDAGAREVAVELEVGGKRRIRVIDDGRGMGADDAVLAFDRHATSKIRDFDDLQRVGTLGFRGEALASIAAVAKVDLLTAEEPGDGWRVRIEGSRVRSAAPAARARGTTLEVASLFFNVPARRKFLKLPQTELRRSVEVVQGYCLSCPDVAFRLEHEGRSLVDAAAVERDAEGLRQRIRQLFGGRLVDHLVELPGGGRGEETMAGFVGDRTTARGRRLFVFVNGRLLRDRQILAAFYRSVRDEWKHDEFPSLFLFLGVPPEELDVNVHPQKAEVRFRDRGFVPRVEEVIRAGLRQARGEAGAPLRVAGPGSYSGAIAWQGLGQPLPEIGEARPAFDSGGPGAGSATKIAEVGYGRPAPATVPLSGPGGEDRSLRVLGQYKGALVLLESNRGLLLMDQHAAHERILYERVARSMAASEPAVQRLLLPELLDLGPAERLRLTELVPGLARLGFLLEPLSAGDLALVGVPAALEDHEAIGLILELATHPRRGDAEDVDALRREVLEAVAASRGCRGAIKIHRPLPPQEMQALVADLFGCEDPYACPHGRPTLLEMTDAELERRFERR